MTKPSRPTALVALLLACALLSAGFVSHGHDDGHFGDDHHHHHHHHHCIICCVRHHSPVATPTAPAPSAPDPATQTAASSCRESGCDATLATQPTRGPPA